jgi:hypothetical protein
VQTRTKEHNNYSSQQQEPMLNRSKNRNPRPLTTDEVCQVNLATIREGVNHCRWPVEVIQRFLAVEV